MGSIPAGTIFLGSFLGAQKKLNNIFYDRYESKMRSFQVNDFDISFWRVVLSSSWIRDYCREIGEELCDDDDRVEFLEKLHNKMNFQMEDVEVILDILVEPEDTLLGYWEDSPIGKCITFRIANNDENYGVVVKDDIIQGEFLFADSLQKPSIIFTRMPEYITYFQDFVNHIDS